MTRSIFDPAGGETEQSGSRNLGPAADNISHMPPDVIDGDVPDEATGEGTDVEDVADESSDNSVPGFKPDARQPEASNVERPVNPGQAAE